MAKRYIDAEKLKELLLLDQSGIKDKLKHEVLYPERKLECKAHIDAIEYCVEQINKLPTADVVEIPDSGIGDISDGYHTFNELYHHRAVLFSVICNSMPDKAWKSKLHDIGDMFDGMFIVGIETPNGQATYHYDIAPYWDMFKVKEFEKAPKWDGHTPADAIKRITDISADVAEVVFCKDCKHRETPCCPMRYIENIDWDDDGYTERDSILHDSTADNAFCSCGERRKDDDV